MKALSLILVSALFYLHAETPFESEKGALSRIRSHLVIQDYQSAYKELNEALVHFPEALSLQKLMVEVAAKSGHVDHSLQTFCAINARVSDAKERRNLLEQLAWGIILEGEHSSQLTSRMTSLMGAFFTRDLRGAKAIERALESTNAMLRSLAIQLTTHYRDDILCEKLLELCRSEKSLFVRSTLFYVIGELRLTEASELLQNLLMRRDLDADQRAIILQSLTKIHEKIDDRDLRKLLLSDRAMLRLLGCKVIHYLEKYEEKETLVQMLDDTSSDVRLAAISILASFPNDELQPIFEQIKDRLETAPPEFALVGASIALRLGAPLGETLFERYLADPEVRVKRLAAAALSSSGKRAKKLLKAGLSKANDPYVRANLALGLIGLRSHLDKACKSLYDFLEKNRESLMLDTFSHPLFSMIAPSKVRHTPQHPRYPELIDHKTRLTLFSLLTTLRFPNAEEGVRRFLKGGDWTVGANAMLTLLQEGNHQSLDIVIQFLDDKDPKLRLGAALALAFIGKDARSAKVLCELYPQVSHETKLVILEALTSVGSGEALPTLIEALKEPFQVLRIAAASGIVQSINH